LISNATNTSLAGLDMGGISLSNSNATGTGTFLGHFMSITLQGNTPASMFQYRGSTAYSSVTTQTLALAYGIFSQHSMNSNHTITNLYAVGTDFEGSTGTITNLVHYRANQTFTGTSTNTIGFLVDDVTTGTQTNIGYGFFNKDASSFNAFNQDTVIGSTNATNPVPTARLQLIGKNTVSEILRGTSSTLSTRFIADDNGRWAFNNSIDSTSTMIVRSVQAIGTESVLDVRKGATTYFKVQDNGPTEISPAGSSAPRFVFSGDSITQPDSANFFTLRVGSGSLQAIRMADQAGEPVLMYGASGWASAGYHEFKRGTAGYATVTWHNSSNDVVGRLSGTTNGFIDVIDTVSTNESRFDANSIGKRVGTGDFTVFNNMGGDLYLTVTGNRTIFTGGGKLQLAPSTTSYASMNVSVGITPTTPVNGDLWRTSTSVFVRHNGTTFDILNPPGSGSTNTYIFGKNGVLSNGNIIKIATGGGNYNNNQGAPISSNERIEEVIAVFGDYQAGSASNVTISIREFTSSGSGSGTQIISTAGTERASLTYTTPGASGATYYRTIQQTGLSANISQGNILFVSITALAFASANDLTVIVKTKKI